MDFTGRMSISIKIRCRFWWYFSPAWPCSRQRWQRRWGRRWWTQGWRSLQWNRIFHRFLLLCLPPQMLPSLCPSVGRSFDRCGLPVCKSLIFEREVWISNQPFDQFPSQPSPLHACRPPQPWQWWASEPRGSARTPARSSSGSRRGCGSGCWSSCWSGRTATTRQWAAVNMSFTWKKKRSICVYAMHNAYADMHNIHICIAYYTDLGVGGFGEPLCEDGHHGGQHKQGSQRSHKSVKRKSLSKWKEFSQNLFQNMSCIWDLSLKSSMWIMKVK